MVRVQRRIRRHPLRITRAPKKASVKFSTRPMLKYLLGALLVVGILLGYLWQQVQATRMGYKIEELKRVKAGLAEANRELQLEATRLRSLDRIESISKTQLGLVFPEKDEIVLLKEE